MKSVVRAFLAAVNLLYAALFGGPIDGTAWDIKVRKDGILHWGSKREILVFYSGKMVVVGAVNRGYAPTLYDPSQEAIEWSGRVDGERITG